jgi:hypothetical protein
LRCCWIAVTLMQCNDFLLNVDIEVEASWLSCKCFITLVSDTGNKLSPVILLPAINYLLLLLPAINYLLLLLPAINYLLLLLPAVNYLWPHLGFLVEQSATSNSIPPSPSSTYSPLSYWLITGETFVGFCCRWGGKLRPNPKSLTRGKCRLWHRGFGFWLQSLLYIRLGSQLQNWVSYPTFLFE